LSTVYTTIKFDVLQYKIAQSHQQILIIRKIVWIILSVDFHPGSTMCTTLHP